MRSAVARHTDQTYAYGRRAAILGRNGGGPGCREERSMYVNDGVTGNLPARRAASDFVDRAWPASACLTCPTVVRLSAHSPSPSSRAQPTASSTPRTPPDALRTSHRRRLPAGTESEHSIDARDQNRRAGACIRTGRPGASAALPGQRRASLLPLLPHRPLPLLPPQARVAPSAARVKTRRIAKEPVLSRMRPPAAQSSPTPFHHVRLHKRAWAPLLIARPPRVE